MYILHQNIAGLINKSDQLAVCLDELLSKDITVDVLCITEHFMMAGYEKYLNIPNYFLAATFSRTDRKRGGACILLRNGHQWREIHEIGRFSVSGLIECCAIELINYKTVVVCIYRVPKISNLNLFYIKLENVLKFISKKKYTQIVIAGDFNINVLIRNNIVLDFECLLLNYNLTLALRQPTRLQSQTCIDNFAHNCQKKCKTEVLELALSDHTAQLLCCPIKKNCLLKFWKQKRRDYSVENILKFKNYLKALSFSEVYGTSDANVAYKKFIDIFRLLYKLCFPYRLVTIRVDKKSKWISRGIKVCSKKKRQLLTNFRMNPTNTTKTKYVKHTKLLKKIIRLTKKSQNNHKIKTSLNKSKATWQIINDVRHNLPRQPIDKIKVDGELTTNPDTIANAFNNYFVDKIVPLSGSGLNVTQHITSSNNSMFMAPCLPSDVYNIISGLRNTASVGYDGITTKIVKCVNDCICSHLSHIINLCITTGTFPDDLKKTVVKPLFKKEDRTLMEYYRPIALIPIISKIFEKYFYLKLNDYFEKFNMLCDEQKGFRRSKTINMAIYEFLDNVISNMDKNNAVCAIYCDMSQAFDYVNHDILINKLQAYGIRGNVLDLIKSYLSNRKQITTITKVNLKSKKEEVYSSSERIVKFGVPQGSVLGPLLFIVYINDLPKVINHPMTLFADDSTVSVACHNREYYESNINSTLDSIINWLSNNNLKININKTNLMQFTQRHNFVPNMNINYQNKSINEIESTKFLGIIIDTKLDWKVHTEDLAKRLSSSAYALYKLAPVVQIDALLNAYHGLVAAILRYGLVFWGNSTLFNLVFKAQKRCIRSMFGLQTTDSCKPKFIEYKILTLSSLYILEVAIFVKSNPNYFPRLCDRVQRNRRDQYKLCLPKAKKSLMRNSIFCMGPVIYNKLPKHLRELDIHNFKIKLKSILAETCYYTVNEFLSDPELN